MYQWTETVLTSSVNINDKWAISNGQILEVYKNIWNNKEKFPSYQKQYKVIQIYLEI